MFCPAHPTTLELPKCALYYGMCVGMEVIVVQLLRGLRVDKGSHQPVLGGFGHISHHLNIVTHCSINRIEDLLSIKYKRCLPTSYPSLPAPASNRIPTVLLWKIKESWVPPGQQATTFRMRQSASQITYMLIDFFVINCIESVDGALRHMQVQLMDPKVFAVPAMPGNLLFTSLWCCSSKGNLIIDGYLPYDAI